jgi:hypothetical protein
MTRHSEIRVPLNEVRLVIRCTTCRAEAHIDPTCLEQRQKIVGGTRSKMPCTVCYADFDSATVTAVHDFFSAIENAKTGGQITLAVRVDA